MDAERIQLARCDHQPNDRSEHREQHHARLHERDEVSQAHCRAGPRRQLQVRYGNRVALMVSFLRARDLPSRDPQSLVLFMANFHGSTVHRKDPRRRLRRVRRQ